MSSHGDRLDAGVAAAAVIAAAVVAVYVVLVGAIDAANQAWAALTAPRTFVPLWVLLEVVVGAATLYLLGWGVRRVQD